MALNYSTKESYVIVALSENLSATLKDMWENDPGLLYGIKSQSVRRNWETTKKLNQGSMSSVQDLNLRPSELKDVTNR
jgi:hypothetical protein